MPRRFVSIGLRFPLLITATVLTTSAVFVWAAYREFTGVLYATAAAKLESNASLISGLATPGTSPMLGVHGQAARSAPVRRLLTTTERSDALATQTLATAFPPTADSTRLQVTVLDAKGTQRLAHVVLATDTIPRTSWAAAQAARGELSTTTATRSPLAAHDGRAFYESIVPVHARDDGESHIGYLVETRLVRGRNVDAVQGLVGTEILRLGDPASGVWTDFVNLVPEPPPLKVMDSAFTFDDSPQGPGIGVAKAVPGTPWVIWLQYSRRDVLAPARTFVWSMAPVAVVIALIGAILTWLFSRRITRRITRLTAELDRVVAEPTRTPTPAPPGRDELDRLEESFQLMERRTEKQQALEAQLMQAQKLEAVGRLAGGIAHDFNNMLTVVTNYGEMIKTELPPGSAAAHDMDEVLHAAQGASKLTRQLLAFSRRQIIQPVPIDLNEVIRGSHRMLQRLIPSNVEFTLDLDPTIGSVSADPSQIEQVLMNLTLNSADAMPQGGRLSFRTTLAELDVAEGTGNDVAQSKRHVCLIVADSGTGMDRETVSHVFEPFFTTKPVGKGTGLGLASVHGIVTQLGGRIWVYSELGHGTTFKIHFPELPRLGARTPPRSAFQILPRGKGTVLLVEDDPATMEVTRRILTRHGYDVVLATNGVKAIDVLAAGAAPIALVLSDVMMPEMDGMELASQIAERWPAMPVVLMSGYSDTNLRTRSGRASTFQLIEKPFTSASLLAAAAKAISDDA